MTRYRVEVEQTATGWVEVDTDDYGLDPDSSIDEVRALVVQLVRDGDTTPDWEWASADAISTELLTRRPGIEGSVT